jgi:hypothetical protein
MLRVEFKENKMRQKVKDQLKTYCGFTSKLDNYSDCKRLYDLLASNDLIAAYTKDKRAFIQEFVGIPGNIGNYIQFSKAQTYDSAVEMYLEGKAVVFDRALSSVTVCDRLAAARLTSLRENASGKWRLRERSIGVADQTVYYSNCNEYTESCSEEELQILIDAHNALVEKCESLEAALQIVKMRGKTGTCDCGCGKKTKAHTCPYAMEIYEDPRLCYCCEDKIDNCRDDI